MAPVIPFIPLITAVVGGGVAAKGAYDASKQAKSARHDAERGALAPPPPAPALALEAPAGEDPTKLKRKRGRSSTILTKGSGLGDSGNSSQPTLLGE